MVFIKDVSGNADAGTAQKWGGNDINYLDDYFDNVDITPKIARINTRTYFRDDKFEWRNPADTFSYIVSTGAITANRIAALPILTADDTFAFRGIDNTFSQAQSIILSGADVLYLRRTTSTAALGPNIVFQALDSGAATQEYGRLRFEIADSTAGSEDGRAMIWLTKAGSDQEEIFKIDNNANLSLYNANINAIGTSWGVIFDADDSGSVRQKYGEIQAEITDDTAGAEDARFDFLLVDDGTLSTRFRINDNGLTEIFGASGVSDVFRIDRDSGTNGDTVAMLFRMNDSAAGNQDYARINAEIIDNTAGSEDGRLEFSVVTGGTLTESLLIHDNGDIDIPRGGLDILDDGNADLLDLERSDNTVGNENGINFWLEDSTAAMNKYARINAEIVTNTNGAEDGDLVFQAQNDGTLTKVFRVVGDESLVRIESNVYDGLDIYRPNNTVDDLQPGLKFSKNNSSSVRTGIGWIYMNLITNTAGDEDSNFQFWNVRDGTSNRVATLGPRGGLLIGPDGNNANFVTRNITKSGTPVNFNNTSAEQTLFTQNVIADTMGANGYLHLILCGSIRQNQATATTYTLRCKFGGTTFYENSVGSLAQDADYLIFRLDLVVGNQNDASSQLANGIWVMNTAEAATTGWGPISDDEIQGNGVFAGSTTKNTDTTSNSLAVTMQMSVANAATEVNKDYAVLDICPSRS